MKSVLVELNGALVKKVELVEIGVFALELPTKVIMWRHSNRSSTTLKYYLLILRSNTI